MTSAKKDDSIDYDEYYFRYACGPAYERNERWLGFFGDIAEAIVKRIAPRSVLDAGCAMGFLVEELRKRGVETWGIDISEYAIGQVHPDVKPYCSLGSVTESFPRQYDLIVCIEILEHLTSREAEQAIKNFSQHTSDVLFSSTPFDYKEATHVNVQPLEYWAELFAQYGFFRDVEFDAAFIAPWAMRLSRKDAPLHRVVRRYERKFWLLWKENIDLRQRTRELHNQLSQKERELAAKDQQFTEVINSDTWMLAKKFQELRLRLMPLGSTREKLFRGKK